MYLYILSKQDMFSIMIDESGDYQECYAKLKRIMHDLYPGAEVMDMEQVLAKDGSPCDVWFEIQETADTERWKYNVNFYVLPAHGALGKYPDIKLSEIFYQTYQWNCLIDTNYLFENMDYLDPYWAVALVNGRWYLADTAKTKLMGPYMDGNEEYAGEREVQLISPLGLSKPKEYMFDLKALINKKAS